MRGRLFEPKDFQIRISYILVGDKHTEGFWTTKTIITGLTKHPKKSKEFGRALRALNYQIRHRAGFLSRGDDFRLEVLPQDVVGDPGLVARKTRIEHVQQVLLGSEKTKRIEYLAPPIHDGSLTRKKDPYTQKEQLFYNL